MKIVLDLNDDKVCHDMILAYVEKKFGVDFNLIEAQRAGVEQFGCSYYNKFILEVEKED